MLVAKEKVTQAALHHLQANPNKTFAITFITNLQRGVDSITQTAINQGAQFDCKACCSYCCHVRVEPLEPEFFQIANILKALPPEDLERITACLEQHTNNTKDVATADYHSACPFLEENLCSIYHVRPAACRKAHSYDVKQCGTSGAAIPHSIEVILKSETLMKGTAQAYQQARLTASGHDLGQAVLLVLGDDTMESRWHGSESLLQ